MSNFESLAQMVIAGQEEEIKAAVKNLLDAGVDPLDIINNGLVAGMNVVGVKFKSGEMFVPEVLKSAKAMAAGMELVKPLLTDKKVESKGKVLLGTVKGDLHDIGKNLVAMMLESAGLEVIDLGIDVDPEDFINAVYEYEPQIVGMSALLTTTMPRMKETIEMFEEEGIRDKVKIIVGGAPVTKDFAEKIGADGTAPDAASATELCLKLLGKA
ncbi:cobalamin B12-binding domain-containing protein [Carboxydothermus ferrireducens]|uniref:5-methyltetrahydrofolate--homocysteine methyltransferase n=1 Tax=Carboxydothermus ferrireducens DSM 11255 TaxID=1119529 RepID=A0ABX2RBV7_9THEO|nr:corrinoid protein [Carboxydothermus ferrireducens]NYE58500.1 5-methyltetrahydrofolate--homocysteine methyltransferase [Carboxydothermus ferrireducens DSM 11255]